MKARSIISFVSLLILLVVSFIISPDASAQQVIACELGNDSVSADVQMEPTGEQNVDYDPADPYSVSVTVYFEGTCAGHPFKLEIIEDDETSSPAFSKTYISPLDYGIFTQNFKAGTLECEDAEILGIGDDCAYQPKVTVYDKDGTTVLDSSTQFSELEYNVPSENYTIPWTELDASWTQNEDITPCRATEIAIFTIDETSGARTPISPGQQSASFYSDSKPPLIVVQQRLRDCGGKTGEVFGPRHNIDNDASISSLDSYITTNNIVTPYDNVRIEAVYRLGDDGCGEGPDEECRLLFPTRAQSDYWLFLWAGIANFEASIEDVEVSQAYYNALKNSGGFITYNCDGSCDTEWGGVTVTQAERCLDETCSATEPIEIAGNQFLAGYLQSIQDSPCYIPPANQNDPSDIGTIKPDCYELLAPLPGLQALGVPLNNETNEGFEDGVFTTEFTLGIWINRIIRFLIGVIGLAAVVMIVVAGAQYMTTEAIGQKSDAKDRIVQALIGLVIALGIFVILNTINPYLLRVDPDIQEATLEYDDVTEAPLITDANGNTSYDYSYCSNGAPDITTGCPNCEPFQSSELATTIPDQKNRNLDATYKAKLVSFRDALISYNNTVDASKQVSAVITEAYEPTTMRHCSQCHYSGTCTDIALRFNGARVGGLDAQTVAPMVEAFLTNASASGLRAVYEIKPGARCDEMKAFMPSSLKASVKCIPHITAEHFSVYNN